MLLKIINDKERGRCVIASRKIKKGEVVLNEEAVAHVVKGEVRLGCCQYCSKITSENAYACNAEDYYRYCSEECIKLDYPVHKLEIDCLSRLWKMKGLITSDTNSGDEAAEAAREKELEPLRLIIRAAAEKKAAGKEDRFQQLLGLEAATSPEMLEEAGSYVKTVSKKMSILLKVCGLEATEEQISHLIYAIQCNAHGVLGPVNETKDTAFMDRKYATLAVGFFPMTSMINHSCRPNCTHYFTSGDKQTPKLTMRAVKDIEEGEELVYSYITLYQSTAQRRAMLRRAYAFECHCPRCEESDDADISDTSSTAGSNTMLTGVILSMQRIAKNSLLADKKIELLNLVDEIKTLLHAEVSETVPSPYNESLFFAYNCVLQTTTVLLQGAPAGGLDKYSPTEGEKKELLKLHIAFGLLTFGALSKYIAVPQMETAMILFRIVSNLDILIENKGECSVAVKEDECMSEIVKRVYRYCIDGNSTPDSVFKNSEMPIALSAVMEGAAANLDRPFGEEGLLCVRGAIKAHADAISEICKGVNSSAW